MKRNSFSFDLPSELIAQYPPPRREDSRLMIVDRAGGKIEHAMVGDLTSRVEEGDLLVLNDSRVRKARLYGVAQKGSGAKREFLLLRELDDALWECLVKNAKKQRKGALFSFPGGVVGEIIKEERNLRWVRFDRKIDDAYLTKKAFLPLPPYIKREPQTIDEERYQPIFSKEIGSAASPTAGLHFTKRMLDALMKRKVEIVSVTLHVGLGTFAPVRTEHIEEHRMHEESFHISEETAMKVEKAVREKRRIIAVGTTSVRALESAWTGTKLRRGDQKTNIFIYPGYRFHVIDALLTNFHTPESTLLMLVTAFLGKDLLNEAYEEAITRRYRFFSYGDAMLIT